MCEIMVSQWSNTDQLVPLAEQELTCTATSQYEELDIIFSHVIFIHVEHAHTSLTRHVNMKRVRAETDSSGTGSDVKQRRVEVK